MRLHLASIDHDEPENHYRPDYVQAEDQVFQTKRVQIDNHQFRRCKFLACTFLHAGGPFGFDECDIDDDSTLVSTGAAHRGVILWATLAQRIGRAFPGVS